MVGQHIGKYRVTQQVGRGGMGTVYLAVDQTLHREVAIKVLNAGLDDPTVGRRFRAEAVTVARLNHPGIATIYELVAHQGQWLMVMEFVRGETLEQAIESHGALPVPHAADIVMQMLAALAHAHGLGVVHRDLKPANIMLTPGRGVKIMDFGIARVAGAEQLTTAGFMMGTPAYMAPEQVLGAEIDARTDLYAVGLVLFQAVTGTMPFEGSTAVQVAQARVNEAPIPVAEVRPDLPAWVGEVIDIALAREPDRRFHSAMLFREAVRRGLANLSIEATPPALVPPEITATAAPGALRIIRPDPMPAAAPPRPAPSAAMETMATPVATPVEQVPARSGLPSAVMGGLAAAMLVVVAGVWFLMRSPAAVDAVVPVDLAAASAPASGGAAAAPTPGGPAVPDSSAGPMPSPAGPPAVPAAESSGPVPVPAPTPAAPAPPPSLEPLVFRGVRALLVAEHRADERPAVLTFAASGVTLFDDAGATALGSLPSRQITSAAYTRARHPRWYPTLAGPPIDVDMPGGVFRGDQHWLALQSRDGYLIVRMNDSDWRQITAAVTSRLGLEVSELRP